jgi:hypothetical protein
MMHAKTGLPPFCQFHQMYYGIITRPVDRLEPDPGAVGLNAYYFYVDPSSHNSTNREYDLGGICHDVNIIKNDHPILRDYQDESIYLRTWSPGSFVNIPDGVSVLASFPDDLWENNQSQDLHAWEYTPYSFSALAALTELTNVLKKGFGEGTSFPFSFLSELPFWNQTSEIIKTEAPGNPAIIAFNNGAGRAVLSAPHPLNPIWRDAELVENSKTKGASWDEGLFHWVKDGKILSINDLPSNNDTL